MSAVSARRAGRSESGFAMLIVFVLAAVIAISLYMEMPRVAFEKQRDREQMLVDRGLQYRRGIQLYYRKFGLYPTSMDDLETKNNMRFLRHRYKDPMTGKDEWRLIHMGPGGVLTDSLLQKPPDPMKGGQPGSPDSSGATASNNGTATGTGTPNGTGAPGTDPNNPNGDPNAGGINFATARRPSDHVPGSPAASASTDPYQQQYPGQPGYPPPQPDPSQSQYPTQPQYPAQPLYPGQPPDSLRDNPWRRIPPASPATRISSNPNSRRTPTIPTAIPRELPRSIRPAFSRDYSRDNPANRRNPANRCCPGNNTPASR
jgi:type II secretory pathway pseudopilin PulG